MPGHGPRRQKPPDQGSPAMVSPDDLLDCIWRLDMQLKITYASAATDTMLGIPATALFGSPLADHTTTDGLASLRKALADLLAGPDRTAGLLLTIDLNHADGHPVPCELHGRLFLDRFGAPVELLCSLRDITTRQLAQHAARQADHRRFESQKMSAIGQLAGGVLGDLEDLLKALDACPETAEHPELAPLRQQAADRIAQLRTLAGRQDLELENLDVDSVVAELVAALRPEMPDGVTIAHRRRSGNSTIRADRGQFLEVLRNLCLNARDALPQGGAITVTTGVRKVRPAPDFPSAAAPGPWVTVEVRDTGGGLDQATRERIFDPFFTTKTGHGGLSLPLAHGIIKQHGGRLEVDSSPGQGSNFRVLLPARFAGETQTAGNEERSQRATIVLVDDDP